MTSKQKNYRQVATYRIKKDRFDKLKEVCKKNKISHCQMTEILVEKFLRGEIIILSSDFNLK